MIKKILIIIVILVLIILILLFLFSQRKAPVTNNQSSTANQQVVNQPVVNQQVVQPRELTTEEKLALLKNELMIKARNFAERHGSYSTDARFANLYELKNEMTARFWRETENYIVQKEKEISPEFYGVSTKVLNIVERTYSNSAATYLVSTQRQEIRGTAPRVFYQEADLVMAKEGEVWKINQIIWR